MLKAPAENPMGLNLSVINYANCIPALSLTGHIKIIKIYSIFTVVGFITTSFGKWTSRIPFS